MATIEVNIDDNTSQNSGEPDQKHDEGYKTVLSNIHNFLHFLKKYIAAPWTVNITVDDIELVDRTFITAEFSGIDSDLIHKVRINGSDVYFYVLVELQSQVDQTMPFRLLRYMVELLWTIFKNTDKDIRERKDFRLPAIVPIILYNGNDNWTVVKSFREYTKNHEIFGDNIIDFHYLLFDVKRTDEATILSTKKMLDIVFLLDKRRLENKISNKDIETCLEKHTSDIFGEDALTLFSWIKHILCKGDLSPEEEHKFRTILKGGGVAMKHALEIWRDELVDEAKREEALKIADKMKAAGKDVNEIAEFTGLTVDEILQR